MIESNIKAIVRLNSKEQFEKLKGNGSITVGDEVILYSPGDTIYFTGDDISKQVTINKENIKSLNTNKLDKNQGISNAGKAMIVGADGTLSPQALAEGGTTVTVGDQPQTVWNADQKADASSLAAVATSGSYDDLEDKPTIPTDNSQLANGAGYATVSQIPTNNNQLINGADYATTSEVTTAVSAKTAVNVNNQLQSTINFNSDPQSQINSLNTNKLDKNQDISNANKVLVVGSDGNITPQDMTSIKKQTFSSYQDFYSFYSNNDFDNILIVLSTDSQTINAYDEQTNLTTGDRSFSSVELKITEVKYSTSGVSFRATYTKTGSTINISFVTLYGNATFSADAININGAGSLIDTTSSLLHSFSFRSTLSTTQDMTIDVYYF